MARFRVIDASTGEAVEVEEAEASAGLASGRYRSGDGAPVRVRLADGGVAEADAAGAADLLRSGAAVGLDTPEYAEERRLEREYGDSPVRAGVAGAARGVTVGLSDVAGSALGFAEPLRELQERNPDASTAGEVAGTIAPLLLSGGSSAVARAGVGAARAAEGGGLLTRALRIATAPSRGVAAAGELAERSVLGLLGGTARTGSGRIAQRAASLGAAGAVEGAAYGAGDVLSESALGDHELTAETLLAGLGYGALSGGAGGALFGGGLGLLGEGARATWAGVRRAGRASRDLLERAWSEQTGTTLRPGVAELYERAAETIADAGHIATGEPRDFIRQGLSLSQDGQRLRDIIRRGDEVYADGTRRIVDDINATEIANRHAQDFWGHGLKREQIRGAIGGDVSIGERAHVVRGGLDELGAWADRVIANPHASARATLQQATRLRAFVDAQIDALERIANPGRGEGGRFRRVVANPQEVASDLFMLADQTKRHLGRVQGFVERAGDAQAVSDLREIYQRTLRAPLEDRRLWGDAADIQREVNEIYTRYLTRRSPYERAFLGDVARDDVDPFRRIGQADSARVDGFLRGVGTAANDTRASVFREVLTTGDELSQAMLRRMDLPDNVRREIAEGGVATRRALATLDDVENAASALNQFRRLETQGSVERALVAGAAGRLVGGRLGDFAASAMASPAQAIRVLSAIEQVRARVQARTTRSVRRFLDRAMQTGRQIGEGAAAKGRRARTRAAEGIGALAGHEAFNEAVREVAEAQADPGGHAEALGRRTSSMSDDAPRTQLALQQATMRGTAFLAARIPPGAVASSNAIPGARRRPRVSDGERARFMRYVEAVRDPLGVLDDLERRRLTREGVQTLREVYPRLYADLTATVLREIADRAERGRPMAYSDQLQLGVLLGVPTTPSLKPSNIVMLQANLAALGAQQQLGAPTMRPRSRSSGSAPSVSGSFASEMQRIEARRGGG